MTQLGDRGALELSRVAPEQPRERRVDRHDPQLAIEQGLADRRVLERGAEQRLGPLAAPAGSPGARRRSPPSSAAGRDRTASARSRPRHARSRGRRPARRRCAAVRKMIGMSRVRSRRLIRRAVSSPSMPGIRTSSRITAKSRSSSSRSAWPPEVAVTSGSPSGASTASSARRFSGRSSTSRIRSASTPSAATGVAASRCQRRRAAGALSRCRATPASSQRAGRGRPAS